MPKMTDDDWDESVAFSPAAFASAVGTPPVMPQPMGNPLASYFRLPGLSVGLPSGGAFFAPGDIDLDDNGEVAIQRMRGIDEILLSSPDALMNNTAVTNMIASCVPAIKRPDQVVAPDLDVILLAIKVATSGDEMDVEIQCPECKHNAEFGVHLPTLLHSAKPIPPSNPVRISDEMVVYVQPHTIAVQTRVLLAAFKTTRESQAIDANPESTDEMRQAQMDKMMRQLGAMNNYTVANSIVKVVIPNREVTDRNHITEFVDNCDSATLKKLSARIEQLNNLGIDKNIPVSCPKCEHEWTTAMEFNPATFFAPRSSN